MAMKPQDILVLLQLVTYGDELWSYAGLAENVSISVGEAHHSVERLQLAGLVRHRLRGPSVPKRATVRAGIDMAVARPAALEFLVHGLRYVYPPEYSGVGRGLPTASAAPGLAGLLVATEPPVVWPFAKGDVRGQLLEPFHPSMPDAAARDPGLYRLLAIAELLRIGSARERSVAADALKAAFKG